MIQLAVPAVIPADRQFHTAIDLRGLSGADVTGFTTYTVVTKIRSEENLVGGSKLRVWLYGPQTANGGVSAVYFGEAATSGHAYDFATTPTAVTFSGKTSLTLTARKAFVSDPIVFDFNPAKAHLIAMNVSASTIRRITDGGGTRGIVSYYKAATSEAGTAAKSAGYTTQAHTSYSFVIAAAQRAPDNYD